MIPGLLIGAGFVAGLVIGIVREARKRMAAAERERFQLELESYQLRERAHEVRRRPRSLP